MWNGPIMDGDDAFTNAYQLTTTTNYHNNHNHDNNNNNNSAHLSANSNIPLAHPHLHYFYSQPSRYYHPISSPGPSSHRHTQPQNVFLGHPQNVAVSPGSRTEPI